MAGIDTVLETPPPGSRQKVRGLGYENQWALTWRKFKRHRLGVAGAIVVLGLLGMILFYVVDVGERAMLPWYVSRRREAAHRPPGASM